ncbi:hypothetical protein SDJN02_24090 [Cucurbita argyrosperma subsp. argyrosperma]|nr:hypothetical protein SDJN02_24090 [Cucurbita argyrosperma subsp. argyrosperma]
MQIAATNFFLSANPKAIYHKQTADCFTPNLTSISVSFPSQMGYGSRKISVSKSNRYLPAACAALSEDVSVSSSQFEDFSVTKATNINENKELKICIEVSGAKTRAIFDIVFNEMVDKAQPIPGFRRAKGGNIQRRVSYSSCSWLSFLFYQYQSNNVASTIVFGRAVVYFTRMVKIPREILLEILGPSKVYKQVIKEVINSTVAAYVEKEALKVGKHLRIEQSYEDLEDQFEPDEKFFFDAIIQLNQTN